MTHFRSDFPIFQHQSDLAYLDSASTTQMPQCTITALHNYFTQGRANIHRGAYQLAERSEDIYTASKRVVAGWIGAESGHEIVYSYNATYAFNLFVQSLIISNKVTRGDKVLVGTWDHHASLAPWLEAGARYGFEVVWIKVDAFGYLLVDDLRENMDDRVRVVSIAHASNVTGAVNDIESFGKHLPADVIYVIDVSQSVSHLALDFSQSRADAFIFTAHKVFADTGLGVLAVKKPLLKSLQSAFIGGGAISNVSLITWVVQGGIPDRFEPGTPHISGALSLKTSLEYLQSKGGPPSIQAVENALIEDFFDLLDGFYTQFPHFAPTIRLVGPTRGMERVSVWSFEMRGKHPSDVADFLADKNICVRVGQHCAEPLATALQVTSTLRVSASIYTTRADLERFFIVLAEALA